MASQSQILREYLVSLGFQVNKDSQRVFDTTLGKTNLNVKALGLAVVSVTTATLAMVTQFARGMEKMYYSSRLAESTVGNMQAMSFAAKSVGVEGANMEGALKGMAAAIRSNPGLKSLVESFGIKVTGRDMSDVATDLLGTLRKMPFYVGSQYAGLFGIDPDTYLLLTESLEKFKQMAELRKEMAKDAGVDADEAARASLEYSQLLRNLTERVSLLKDALAIALLPTATKFIAILDEGVTRLTKMITNAHQQAPALNAELKKVTPDGSGGVWGAYTAIAGKTREALWNWITTGKAFVNDGKQKVSGVVGNTGSMDLTQPLGLRNNNPGNLRSWGNTPTSGGFAQFGDMRDGLSAMAGNLLAYSRQGVNTVDGIIKRWAPASDNNNTGAYIAHVSKLMGVKAGDALDMQNPDTLAALMGAITQHENGRNPFSMDELRQSAMSRLSPVVLQQQTTIHVHGGDASATGRAVAGEQSRVNQDAAAILRNQVGAVQ